jgi:CP family cyanate transporter-like MFS transporter
MRGPGHAPREASPPAVPSRPLHRNRTALAITGFLGVQALLYFAVTSWLPTFLADRGASPAEASGLLAWYSVAGLPASLTVPMLMARGPWARILGPGLGIVTAAGLGWLLLGPLTLVPGAIALLGLAQSSTFAFSLALVVLRSRDAATAGRLSALSQGAGFALAAVGPYAVGWAHTATGAWEAPFAGMAAGAVILVGLGAMAVRGPDVE